MTTKSKRAGRLGRLALAGSMLVAWSGAIPFAAAQQGKPPSPEQVRQDVAKEIALLESLCKAADDELRKPGADPSDVHAKARELANDRDRVFQFVRDEIAFEPYRGMLRGPAGALAARSANALDRALLLREMLEAGGQRCRLVKGTLAADAATILVDRFLSKGGGPGVMIEPVDAPDAIPELAAKAGMDAAKLREYQADAQKTAEAFEKETWTSAIPNAQYLAAQVKAAGVQLGRSADAWRQELAARVAEHYWVQVADPANAGKWIDLDPSFADAKPGDARATGAAPVEKIDEALRHRTRFTLVYTHGEPGQTKADAILDATMYADEALENPPEFVIRPADDLPSAEKLASMPAEEAVKVISSIKKYQAVFRRGGKLTSSRVFDLDGNLFDVAADGRVKGASQIGSATGGLFGGALGGGGDAPAKNPGTFVSLTAEFRFDSPGVARPRTQSRVLLTHDDVKGKHFVTPVLNWEILAQAQPISPKLAGYGVLKTTSEGVKSLLEALRRKSGTPGGAMANAASGERKPHPVTLTGFALARQAAAAKALQENPKLALLWDRPQLIISEQRMCMMKGTGHTCGKRRIDIVDNAVAFVPRTSDAASAAAEATLRQGVYDTVAEGQLLKQMMPDGTPHTAMTGLDALRASGAPLAVFRASESAPAKPAQIAPVDRAWIARHEGEALILAAAGTGNDATESTWWSVDATTGNALGRVAGGGGQALTEENVKLLSVGVKFLICFDDALSSKKSNFGTGLYLAGCYAAGVSGGVTALTGLKTVTWLMSMLILEVVQKKVLQKAS